MSVLTLNCFLPSQINVRSIPPAMFRRSCVANSIGSMAQVSSRVKDRFSTHCGGFKPWYICSSWVRILARSWASECQIVKGQGGTLQCTLWSRDYLSCWSHDFLSCWSHDFLSCWYRLSVEQPCQFKLGGLWRFVVSLLK